jgi:predicted hydrocarbon binding protein
MALNDIIHPEVRKLYPNAQTPWFTFESVDDAQIVMHYHSHRSFCKFGEGLILGSAPHFGERATVEQPICKLRGDDHCILVVRLERSDA